MKIAQWKKGDLSSEETYCKQTEKDFTIETFSANGINYTAIKYPFESQECYSFKEMSLGLSSPVNIKLMNKSNLSNYQTLKKIQNITKLDLTDFTFIPKRNFDYIVFEHAYGNSVSIDKLKSLRKITNIYKKIGEPYITSLGIQGVSGLKFVIDGNVIQVGKSRLYTVSDVDISFIGFIIEDEEEKDDMLIPVPLNRKDNYFIMDYQYEDEEV